MFIIVAVIGETINWLSEEIGKMKEKVRSVAPVV